MKQLCNFCLSTKSKYQGPFGVCVQPMGYDVTMQRCLSLGRRKHKTIFRAYTKAVVIKIGSTVNAQHISGWMYTLFILPWLDSRSKEIHLIFVYISLVSSLVTLLVWSKCMTDPVLWKWWRRMPQRKSSTRLDSHKLNMTRKLSAGVGKMRYAIDTKIWTWHKKQVTDQICQTVKHK